MFTVSVTDDEFVAPVAVFDPVPAVEPVVTAVTKVAVFGTVYEPHTFVGRVFGYVNVFVAHVNPVTVVPGLLSETLTHWSTAVVGLDANVTFAFPE
jgi:hypothetical protein